MRILLTTAVLLLALLVPALQASAMQPRSFDIVIENAKDGRIYILENGQRLDIGKVLVPCGAVNDNGFTASMWGKNSAVTATAVNAMHIKVTNNEATGRGIIFSVLPREFLNVQPEDYKSYLNRNTSIFTDIPAGTAIFGGAHAPFNGCPVIVTPAGSQPEVARALTPDYVPQEGDTLTISVRQETGIDYIEFDNSFGGFITEKRIGQEPEVIGQVLKPVAGVGRFEGSIYARVGRIRASHPGVLCISTSPFNEIGGFQIIPRAHAMSPEMNNARLLTQWMVVGPIDGRDPSWEGMPPLFMGDFYPSYIPLLGDAPDYEGISALNRLLDRFYVLGKMRGSDEWGPLPSVTGRVDDALVNLAAIRIYFPLPMGS
jgi:hypothetical protein